MATIDFDLQLARGIADRLDDLAGVLTGAWNDAMPSLRPAPAGTDAVSQHTAATVGTVGDSFHESYLSGVHELRKIAANLRAHADLHDGAEDDASQTFRSLI